MHFSTLLSSTAHAPQMPQPVPSSVSGGPAAKSEGQPWPSTGVRSDDPAGFPAKDNPTGDGQSGSDQTHANARHTLRADGSLPIAAKTSSLPPPGNDFASVLKAQAQTEIRTPVERTPVDSGLSKPVIAKPVVNGTAHQETTDQTTALTTDSEIRLPDFKDKIVQNRPQIEAVDDARHSAPIDVPKDVATKDVTPRQGEVLPVANALQADPSRGPANTPHVIDENATDFVKSVPPQQETGLAHVPDKPRQVDGHPEVALKQGRQTYQVQGVTHPVMHQSATKLQSAETPAPTVQLSSIVSAQSTVTPTGTPPGGGVNQSAAYPSIQSVSKSHITNGQVPLETDVLAKGPTSQQGDIKQGDMARAEYGRPQPTGVATPPTLAPQKPMTQSVTSQPVIEQGVSLRVPQTPAPAQFMPAQTGTTTPLFPADAPRAIAERRSSEGQGRHAHADLEIRTHMTNAALLATPPQPKPTPVLAFGPQMPPLASLLSSSAGHQDGLTLPSEESEFSVAVSTSQTAQTTHAAALQVARNYAPQVAAQIAQATVHSAGGTTEIALNPEELGRVRITLTSGENGLSVSILAERPETADLMRRNIDSLAREFQNLGHENLSFSFGQDGKQGQPDATSRPNSDVIGLEDAETIDIVAAPTSTLRGGLDLKL